MHYRLKYLLWDFKCVAGAIGESVKNQNYAMINDIMAKGAHDVSTPQSHIKRFTTHPSTVLILQKFIYLVGSLKSVECGQT